MSANTFYFDWEVSLISWLQEYSGKFAAVLSSILGFIGSDIVLVFLVVLVYLGLDKKTGRKAMINTVTGLTFCSEIKNIFTRSRPYIDNDSLVCLAPVDKNADPYDLYAQGFSFPSLHSFNSMSITSSIYQSLKTKIWLAAAIIIPLLVGISRIITANHYPTDVLCGWLLGIISTTVLGKLQDKVEKKKLYPCITAVISTGILFCKSNDYFSGLGIMIGFFIVDIFEERYVNFENTHVLWKLLVRVALSLAVFVAVCETPKLLVSTEFIESTKIIALLFRSLRYGLAAFVSLGLVPMLYKKYKF